MDTIRDTGYKIIKLYSNAYPQLKNIKLDVIVGDKKYAGLCHSELIGEFVLCGKFRYKNIKASKITISKNDPDWMFTLLHEICHVITPYYERKIKNKWIKLDHSHKFYNNLCVIFDFAYKNKVIDSIVTLDRLKLMDQGKISWMKFIFWTD